ncbi:MAG: FAD-dependent oxidoreductase [Spirochaetales bacterium]|nr:FAD-dependent oxidoreductase [Spirochaetales bacterium]
MKHENYDVVVIGGGPAGISAAVAACRQGCFTLIVEREEILGGILKQCIHDGFGLFRYKERLTGPEYAFREQNELNSLPVTVHTSTFLVDICREDEGDGFLMTFVSPDGMLEVRAGAVITATGCRERSGRQIFLHGERPSGIFTAGQAQGFVNLKGYLPGKRIVILGSGDIGLIMARRLTLEGAHVLGVYEIKPEPSGLTRNIAQCLEDYSIPLNLSTTVKSVHGRGRMTGVTICRVDEKLNEIDGTEKNLSCDTLILSVGLIPENEILDKLHVPRDPATSGPEVDQDQMTGLPGLFTCGNAQHVNDLVDYVSESGSMAGRAAAEWAEGRKYTHKAGASIRIKMNRGEGLLYQVPAVINPHGSDPVFYFRAAKTMDGGRLSIKDGRGDEIFSKSFTFLKPPEMERFSLPVSFFQDGSDEFYMDLEEVV